MLEKNRPEAPFIFKVTHVVVLFLLFIPLFVMVVGSFLDKQGQEVNFTFRWYYEILQDQVLISALGRSLFIALFNSIISVLIGTMAAIALYRSNFFSKTFLKSVSMVSLMMPELVFALSLLSWFVVIGLELSLATVIISHVTFCLSFVIMVTTARLDGLDWTIEDAARDLGASDFQFLIKIIFPLLKASCVTSFLLCFLLSFDDFLITFYTSGTGMDTLPIQLYIMMRMGLTPKLSALATLMSSVTACLLVLFGRFKTAN